MKAGHWVHDSNCLKETICFPKPTNSSEAEVSHTYLDMNKYTAGSRLYQFKYIRIIAMACCIGVLA